MKRCKYCASNEHKSNDCIIGIFRQVEIDPPLSYGVEIDTSSSFDILLKALEKIHKDKLEEYIKRQMTDYIYNSITEMPDNVLKGGIMVFENSIAYIKKRKGNVATIKHLERHIRSYKDELARRHPSDSLYAANPDG